jgi:hypothetical protein
MPEETMRIDSAGELARPRRRALSPKRSAFKGARTCYDHLAGELGVAIADRLIALGAIEFEVDSARVTEKGINLLAAIGIQPAVIQGKAPRSSRALCRPCIDCTERRPHIAGKLGAAICAHFLEKGWVRRREGARAVDITPEGRAALRDLLGVY